MSHRLALTATMAGLFLGGSLYAADHTTTTTTTAHHDEAPVADEEPSLSDLRVYGGLAPRHNKFSGDGASADKNFDSALQGGVEYVRSLDAITGNGSWFWGVEGYAEYAKIDATSTTPRNRFYQAGANIMFGYAVALGMPELHLEVNPFIGPSDATYANGSGHQSDLGVQYGARAGVFYTFENDFQVGLEARYSRVKHSYTINGGSFDQTNDGVGAFVDVGYRF